MLKSLLKAQAARRGARFLPGGWLTMMVLSPRGRWVMRSGWSQLQKHRARRRR